MLNLNAFASYIAEGVIKVAPSVHLVVFLFNFPTVAMTSSVRYLVYDPAIRLPPPPPISFCNIFGSISLQRYLPACVRSLRASLAIPRLLIVFISPSLEL